MLNCTLKTLLLVITFVVTPVAKASNLGVIVIGVIASSKDKEGIALIKKRSSGKVKAYKEGAELNAGLKITRIYRKTVEFRKNKQLYSMSVGDTSAYKHEKKRLRAPSVAAPVSNLTSIEGLEKKGDTLVVTRSLKDSLVGENLNKILMQAAAVPHTKNGKLIGFKLLAIDQGSIYDVAGLKNGDIITHINDLPIVDAGRAVKALSSLKTASVANFSYLRSNQAHEIKIQID